MKVRRKEPPSFGTYSANFLQAQSNRINKKAPLRSETVPAMETLYIPICLKKLCSDPVEKLKGPVLLSCDATTGWVPLEQRQACSLEYHGYYKYVNKDLGKAAEAFLKEAPS